MRIVTYGVANLAVEGFPEVWADTVDDFLDELERDRQTMGIIMAGTVRLAVEIVGRARAEGLHNLLFVLFKMETFGVRQTVPTLAAGADRAERWPMRDDLLWQHVHALYRLDGRIAAPELLAIGDMLFSHQSGILAGPQGAVSLSRTESAMLEAIVDARGGIVRVERMLEIVYAHNQRPSKKIVSVFVCKLRKKLKACSKGEWIGTEWGQGYAYDSKGLGYHPAIGLSYHKRPHLRVAP